MKILQIEVTNYRRIKSLFLELNGENMAVAGATDQGKTTSISLLWELLKKVGDPVTHGEKKGQIRITLGDGETEVFVTRSFTAKTAPITILTNKGKSISAGAFADWFCDLGDNPHRIMDMKPKDQAEAMLEAVKLPDGVNLGELDTKRADAARERLDLQRDGRRDAESLGSEPENADRVDIKPLRRQEESAMVVAHDIDELKTNIRVAGDEVKFARDGVAMMTANIARLQNEAESVAIAKKGAEAGISANEIYIKGMEDKLKNTPPPPDSSAIREKIQSANDANAAADRWDAWEVRSNALAKLRAKYKTKDAEVKALDKAKKDALAKAEWPLDGLSIDDGVIVFNGSPLSQCGHSEQMLVCGALAAETISQHKLRVVRMDGVESMSKEDFQRLAKIFNDKGIQVLSSRVTRGDIDDGEIQIVDGNIVSDGGGVGLDT